MTFENGLTFRCLFKWPGIAVDVDIAASKRVWD